jgi:hypothetical protein
MSKQRKNRICPSRERTGYVPAKKGPDMFQQRKDRICPSNEHEKKAYIFVGKVGETEGVLTSGEINVSQRRNHVKSVLLTKGIISICR